LNQYITLIFIIVILPSL